MDVNLHDIHGQPTAYISNDADRTIFMWDGTPVAYLDGDCVYGFNGSHLGWFIRNVIYDLQGHQVGYTKETCPVIVSLAPLKSLKSLKPLKSLKQLRRLKPLFGGAKSSMPLDSFLWAGS